MGVIFDPIGDVVDDVVDVVDDVVEWVGDAVEDVYDFVVDDILSPVVDAVGGVIEGMLDDPLTTVAIIAAVATGQAWAIPLIQGASVGIQGGSLEDVAITVAAAYAGNYAGGVASRAVGGIAGPGIGGQIAAGAASGATRAAVSAAIRGEDILEAAKGGAISGALSAGIAVGTAELGGATESAQPIDIDGISTDWAETAGGVSTQLSDLVEGFNELPQIVQDMATSAATATITSLVTTGEVDPNVVAGALANSALQATVVAGAIDATGMSDMQAALVSAAVGNVVRTAYTGADPYAAYQAAIGEVGQQELNRTIDELTAGGFDRLVDEMTGNSTAEEEARSKRDQSASAVNEKAELANAAADEYDRLRKEAQPQIDELTKLTAGYAADEAVLQQAANEAKALAQQLASELSSHTAERNSIEFQRAALKNEVAAYNSSGRKDAAKGPALEARKVAFENRVKSFNAEENRLKTSVATAKQKKQYVDSLVQKLSNLAPIITSKEAEVDKLVGSLNDYRAKEVEPTYKNYTTALNTYNTDNSSWETAREQLVRDDEYVDDALKPVTAIATKVVVDGLTGGGFNADEYREINGLSSDEDPYDHWLKTGRENLISQKQYDQKLDETLRETLNKTVLSNVDTKLNSIEDIDDFYAAIKETIGNDISIANSPSTLLVAQEYLDKIEAKPTDESVADNVTYEEGVTAGDVASGKAVALFNQIGSTLGITFTSRPNLGGPVFDPRLNRYVQPVWDTKTKQGMYIDPKTKTPIEGYISSTFNSDGLVVIGDSSVVINSLPPPTIRELIKINPVVAIDTAGNLTINEEERSKLDFFSRSLLDISVGVKDTIEYLDTNRAETKEKYGIEVGDLDNLRLNAGTALGAGGELLNGFNGVVSFFRNSRNNPIDARTTNLGKATQAMIGIATATQPEDYNNLVKEWDKSYQSAEGIVGTLQAIGEGLLDPKYRSVVLREVVAKEIIQELPLLLLSAGVGTGVKAGIKGGAYIGRLAGKEFAGETVKQISQKWGSRAAWASNAGLQTLESASATAGETFAITYDELMKLPGMTTEAASARAQEYAITNGLMAAAIEGVAGRVFDPGDKFVSSIVGGRKMTYALSNIGKKVAGVAGEGVSEGLEEGASAYFNYQAAKEINPDSDLFKPGGAYADLGNLLTANSVLGALAGTGTSTSIVAAGSVYNALSGGEPRPPSPLDTPSGGPTQPKIRDTNNVLGNALVNLNFTVNQAANDAGSSDPEVRAAGEATIQEAFGFDADTFDGTTIDLTKDSADDTFRYNTTIDILNSANDNSYTTTYEATTAFDTNTAGIPYVPTDTEIQNLVGSKPQATLQTNVDTLIDTNYTDAGEVAAYFDEFGYTPTQAEIDQNVGQGLETETASAIDEYRGPRQTTSDEVLDYFTSLGYNATDVEAALFAGQGGADFQTTQLATIDPYVDPRQVTRSEVEQFFETEGYKPSEEEINRFIAQANDPNFQATQEQGLITEFDPLAVTSEEVSQAYKDIGFPDALTSDIERFTGQYAESELTGNVRDYIPIATYNSISEMLGKPGQEVTQNDIDFVVDIIAQQEVMTEPTPFTPDQLQYDVNADNVIDIADQTMLEQIMAGTTQQTEVAPANQFAATGIQGQIQNQTQMQQQLQQQIQTQEAERQKRQAQQKQQAYMQQLLETTPVKVETPDPGKIEYVYDPFGDSIFANPEQEALFVNPYTQAKAAAGGGIISALRR